MAAITTQTVSNSRLSQWGEKVYGAEYEISINGKDQRVDFQDLMVALTTQRAAVVEKEVQPMSTRMQNRNKRLEALGNTLSDLSGIQAAFSPDDKGDATKGGLSKDSQNVLTSLNQGALHSGDTISKSNCEKAVQLIKTQIDKLNNESSADMTRLQSLVDKRDESYTTATSLMQSVSQTRSAIIKGMA